MIRDMSKKPAADRSHHKADCEENSGIQLLNNRIITRKERVREIERKGGVGIKVVPLDKVPDGPDENRLQAPAYIGEPQLINCDINFTHSFRESGPQRTATDYMDNADAIPSSV